MRNDSTQKRGVARFFDVLMHEFRALMLLNALFLVCVLPSVVIFAIGLFGYISEIALVLSLVVAFPAGGCLAAYLFCITRMLRDEPGYAWDDFKRKFKENYKQAALPGILCAAFLYAQIYLWGPFLFGGEGVDVVWLIPGGVFLLIFGMVAPYFFLQVAYIDLKTKQLLINSILLSFAKAPRSIIGAVLGGGIWIAFVLLLPESLIMTPLLLLIGFSVSFLINMMWVWPTIDKQFSIDETLRNRRTLEQ